MFTDYPSDATLADIKDAVGEGRSVFVTEWGSDTLAISAEGEDATQTLLNAHT